MNPGAVAATVDALLEVVALKALARTGWVRVGVPGPESVAAHSWGVAWLVLALLPDTMDRERALVYAVIHDLPEVWTGDLTPHDAVPDKAAREHAAITAFSDRLPDRGDAVRGWFAAYEAQADPESRFVRQLDRLDLALQAVAYHRAGAPGMTEFLASADRVITDPTLRPLFEALRARLG